MPATAFTALPGLPAHEHLAAVGMFQPMVHPSEGALRYARPPTRFEKTPASVRRPPPRLGEHSAEVLAEAGYAPAEIAALAERRVVRLGE